RGKGGNGGVQRGRHVDNGHADLHRLAVDVAGNRHDAGLALDDEVGARLVSVWAAAAGAGDRHPDQRGVVLAVLLVADSHALLAAGAEVCDHDLALPCQLAVGRLVLGMLDDPCYAALVVVWREAVGALGDGPGRPPGARVGAAAVAFDLDNVVAETSEAHRA